MNAIMIYMQSTQQTLSIDTMTCYNLSLPLEFGKIQFIPNQMNSPQNALILEYNNH